MYCSLCTKDLMLQASREFLHATSQPFCYIQDLRPQHDTHWQGERASDWRANSKSTQSKTRCLQADINIVRCFSSAGDHTCSDVGVCVPGCDFGAFPYKPYGIQTDLMRSVYAVLEAGGVGLFESPTGNFVVLPTCSLLHHSFIHRNSESFGVHRHW